MMKNICLRRKKNEKNKKGDGLSAFCISSFSFSLVISSLESCLIICSYLYPGSSLLVHLSLHTISFPQSSSDNVLTPDLFLSDTYFFFFLERMHISIIASNTTSGSFYVNFIFLLLQESTWSCDYTLLFGILLLTISGPRSTFPRPYLCPHRDVDTDTSWGGGC